MQLVDKSWNALSVSLVKPLKGWFEVNNASENKYLLKNITQKKNIPCMKEVFMTSIWQIFGKCLSLGDNNLGIKMFRNMFDFWSDPYHI